MKAWPVLGILFIQTFLLSAHWFIYRTVIVFWGGLSPHATLALHVAVFVLAFSFVAASLLSYYSRNGLVTALYRVAAVWMGILNFLFFAALFCWVVWLGVLLLPPHAIPKQTRPLIVGVLLIAAAVTAAYGLINARIVRVVSTTVRLANLPPQWRGRTALVMSDLHLGHVNGIGFSRRIAALAARLNPDILFIPGDVFDGTKVDAYGVIAAFKDLAPPLGIYFATGNHDEFGDAAGFLAALGLAGIRVLSNEKVVVDGLQILGVPYHDTTYPMRLRTNLHGLGIDKSTASILLNHVPNRLPIVEEAGVSLQLSGHTHGGQFVPFTWLTQRVFGKFTHGLHAFGSLQVLTSYGAGTWGPPMRVGTKPEVVLLRFD